jgi:hypothetical protein
MFFSIKIEITLLPKLSQITAFLNVMDYRQQNYPNMLSRWEKELGLIQWFVKLSSGDGAV